jgi:hypothetical protein
MGRTPLPHRPLEMLLFFNNILALPKSGRCEMARDLTIGDKQVNCNNPVCDSAAYCCWYETTREIGDICTNRNNLVCRIRREEVFGESEVIDKAQDQRPLGSGPSVLSA